MARPQPPATSAHDSCAVEQCERLMQQCVPLRHPQKHCATMPSSITLPDFTSFLYALFHHCASLAAPRASPTGAAGKALGSRTSQLAYDRSSNST